MGQSYHLWNYGICFTCRRSPYPTLASPGRAKNHTHQTIGELVKKYTVKNIFPYLYTVLLFLINISTKQLTGKTEKINS